MKITKAAIISVLTIVLLFSTALSLTVLARDDNDVNSDNEVNGNEDKDFESRGQDDTTSTEKKIPDYTMSNTTSAEANDSGQFTAQAHRSVVASFVQSLLNVANRENSTGAQVREIARTQNDSATTTASAMVKIEERNSVRKFFFGSDYKNLRIIQNELNTTNRNIAELTLLLDQTVNEADRAELNSQIQLLETERTKITIYVMTNENTFSLFGWLTKLFVK